MNEYNWDILYSCEDPLILGHLLFDWLKNSIKFIFNVENIIKIKNNLEDFDKCLKIYENQTLIIFCNFIILIKDKEENEEIINQRNIFIKNFCKYSLGYSSDDINLKENEINNIEKLSKIINIIIINQTEINNDHNENKTKILSKVYEHLKELFDDEKTNINKENNKNVDDMFKKINNIMNSGKDLNTFLIPKDDKKEEKEKIIENKKANDNIGIINFNNLNNSTIKFSKSMKMDIRKSKSLFKESMEIIKEIEDNNNDIPWIREEDC